MKPITLHATPRCPYCGEVYTVSLENVVFPDGAPHRVMVLCSQDAKPREGDLNPIRTFSVEWSGLLNYKVTV